MKKSKIKHEFEILNSAISSLVARVKEIEGNTKQVNEPLSELPEKWAINTQYSTDQAEFWFNSTLNRVVYWTGYAHYPEIKKEVCTSKKLHPGYTEISFSDFERLVLKKGEIQNIIETYPGQNNVQNQSIRRDDTIYGFINNGIWATIVEQPKQENFDWDRIGNLVKANDGDGNAILLITSKSKDDKTFTAVCVKGDDINHIGEYSLDYERCSFIPYKGSITLSSEPI